MMSPAIPASETAPVAVVNDIGAHEEIDDLDLKIIAELRRDGRASNRDLARMLGYSEATIRRRVKSLMDDGRMKIVAIADPYLLGYRIDVIINVEVQPGMIREAAHGFAELENVRAVTITTGAADLVVAAIFRSNDELLEFFGSGIAQIPGVVRTSTSHTIRVVKRSFDLFPEHLL